MEFATAQELADHLALAIDDEAFIAKAVRLKFPDWNGGDAKSVFAPKAYHAAEPLTPDAARRAALKSKFAYAARNYTKPDKDAWWAAEQSGRAFHGMVAAGTVDLLAAIRREHPERCVL